MLFLSFCVQPFHQAMANEAEAEAQPAPTLPTEVEEQLPDPDPEPADVVEEEVEETIEDEVVVEEDAVESTDMEPVVDNATEEESVPTDADTDTDTPDTDTDETTTDTDASATASSTTNAGETETSPAPKASTTATSSTSTTGGTQDQGGSGGGSNTAEPAASTTSATTTDTTVVDETPDATASSTTASSTDAADETTSETPAPDQAEDTTPVEDTSEAPSEDTGEDTDLIDSKTKTIEDGVNDLVGNVVNEVVSLTRQLVNDENYYQFSRQSCVAVGDGTYHCTNKDAMPIDPDSAVYAEVDADGDMEIYLRTSKGDVKQLTDNELDDTSPDVDLASMQVVWQRMIDGRYQIISYDLETREETQLTFSRNNSMEPKIAAEGIVWQAWDGNDWEVMYFDGQYTDQITNNDAHDVTPVVEDGYILWSVLGGEKAEARVYSLESGELMTIAGHEGGTVANPRFVLVYDTKFDNGDVLTLGFDPVTGLAEPVGSKPAELPFTIPEPDPVGEIRALIQNKSTQKDQDVVTVPTPDGDADLNLASTTATSTGTLILDTQPDDGAVMPDAASVVPEFELGEYDLVITHEASSTNSVINRPYAVAPTATSTASSTQ